MFITDFINTQTPMGKPISSLPETHFFILPVPFSFKPIFFLCN